MSHAEETFALQVRALKLPAPEREYPFAKSLKRRFRADFAWPANKLLVEIEGGIWINGRHTRGKGFAKDCEKYNTATMLGWRVLRFPPDEVTSGRAVQQVQEALNAQHTILPHHSPEPADHGRSRHPTGRIA